MKSVTRKIKNSTLSELEDKVRAQTKRRQIETAILGSISPSGFLLVATMAPNVIQVLHKAFPDLRPVNQKQSIKKAIGRLIKNGYVKKENDRYQLSQEGEDRLRTLLLHTKSLSGNRKVKKWDKKWRIVIFDVPEKQKTKRNALRSMLIQSGFVKLQSSVWVYPFRCDEVVALLKFNLKLGRSAVYVIADAIEGDEWLRKHFNLPQN